jgi:hypothetical protein
VAPGEYVKLGPGEGLVVAGLDTFETRSDDSTTTVALAVTLGIPTPVLFGLPTAPVPPPGVDVTVLAGGAAHLPTGPVTLGLGRVVLPSAAALPAHRVTGAELVAVEAGTLSLTVDKGNASFDIASAAPIATLSSAEVTTGHGFLATRDTTVEYRNTSSDSLVLLVVTLTPTESAALTATAATGAAVKTTCGTDQRRADWSGQ